MMEEIDQPVNALKMIEQDINRCLGSGFLYAAITLALTIPGVCASAEKEDGWSGHKEYKDWCDRYICKKLSVPSSILYHARCGFVHMARGGFPEGEKKRKDVGWIPSKLGEHKIPALNRAIFTQGGGVHCNRINDAIQFDIGLFCRDVISAMNEWKRDTVQNKTVQTNVKKLTHFYQDGIKPYNRGQPTIA